MCLRVGPKTARSRKKGSSSWGGTKSLHYDIVLKGCSGQAATLAYVYIRYPEGSGPSKGKPKVGKAQTGEGVWMWNLTRGKTTVTIVANNVPFVLWQWYHRNTLDKTGYAQAIAESKGITDARAKKLLKLTTGGKVKLSQVKKGWSQSTARSKGSKAEKAWVGKKVVKKIRFV